MTASRRVPAFPKRRLPCPEVPVTHGWSGLGGLDAERLLMSLTFLAGFCPVVFDEVLEAAEPRAGGEPGLRAEPGPFCTACGANAGIFWLYGV